MLINLIYFCFTSVGLKLYFSLLLDFLQTYTFQSLLVMACSESKENPLSFKGMTCMAYYNVNYVSY